MTAANSPAGAMRSSLSPAAAKESAKLRLLDVVRLGAWCGLATGLAEAVLFLAFQSAGLVSWVVLIAPVDGNALWASPLVDLLLFFVLGMLLTPLVLLFPARLRLAVVIFVLCTTSSYSLISVPGRMTEKGALFLAMGLASVAARWFGRNPEARVQMFVRTLPHLAGLALVVGLGTLAGDALREKIEQARLPAAPAEAPNILLVVLDTLRADHMSAYGYARPTTPFLDSYARGGTRFEYAFAPAPWTVASHASMFTGLYPYQHGAELYGLARPATTLAKVLAEHGYATAGVAANGEVCAHAFGLDQGFQHWDNLYTHPLDVFLRSSLGRKFRKYLRGDVQFGRPMVFMRGEEVNEHALRWLEGLPKRPFFLFLNYMETHDPYLPPTEYARRFAAEPEAISKGRWAILPKRFPAPREPRRRVLNNDAYDSCLAYLDDILKNLFAELARRGLDQNLLVIITSDHGESLGEHGIYRHFSSVYLPQIHVPLIMRMAGKVPAGAVISAPVSTTAIPATVMELAGLEGQKFPGASVSKYWSGDAPTGQELLSEVASRKGFPGLEPNLPNNQGWVKSFENGEWHFILQETGKMELYRWKTDRDEAQNEVENPEVRDMVGAFRARLQQIAAQARHNKQ